MEWVVELRKKYCSGTKDPPRPAGSTAAAPAAGAPAGDREACLSDPPAGLEVYFRLIVSAALHGPRREWPGQAQWASNDNAARVLNTSSPQRT